jgi:hypothetical protein
MLFHHFGFRVIHLAGKELTKKGRRDSNMCCAGAINLTVAVFKTFCLTLKFTRTEKFQVAVSSLGETWENPA